MGPLLWLGLLGAPGPAAAVALSFLQPPLTAMGICEIAALCCGAAAILCCSFLIIRHVRNLKWPEMQVYMIRVILFIPTITIVCILALVWPEGEDAAEMIESFWEAITFHAFLQSIFVYCGGREKVAQFLDSDQGDLRWMFLMFPCTRCIHKKYRDGGHAVASYEWRVACFCFLKPLCDCLRLILDLFGSPKIILNVLNAVSLISTVIAMTAILVLEKNLLKDRLVGMHARLKFWVIKGTILLIIIESQVVAVLADNARTKADVEPSPGEAKAQFLYHVLELMVLYEMFIIATPLCCWTFSLLGNQEVWAHAPSMPPEDNRPLLQLFRAVVLAPWDCICFIGTAWFCCREPEYAKVVEGTDQELMTPTLPPSQSAAHRQPTGSGGRMELEPDNETDPGTVPPSDVRCSFRKARIVSGPELDSEGTSSGASDGAPDDELAPASFKASRQPPGSRGQGQTLIGTGPGQSSRSTRKGTEGEAD